MLVDIANRYSFLDRHGNSLNLDRTTALDQYGKEHSFPFIDLTSVIIISAERGNDTRRCVESIFENTLEPFEIILSDVGSTKETLKIITALEDAHRNIHVIHNKKSTGTTGQRNQGIYFSRGEYVVLMDNDVLVLPAWLKHLKKAAEKDEQIGLVGAKFLKAEIENVHYCGCHTITLEKDGKIYGIGLTKSGPMANLQRHDRLVMRGGEAPWYTTTALLAKRKVLFEVGGFDDMVDGKGIFIANEDKDLSLIIRKGRYKIYYCPDAEAIHNHDYSKVDRKDAYHSKYRLRMEQIEKDTEYFLNKWGITYLIEKLPHEDNSKKWNGKELVRIDLRLDSDKFKNDIVILV
ncbi:MAG: glycosyltransferase [Deltaproteobacteria bacterium]|nr:glycosyltransferase [Deltaproteobacteria bacterium]MBW1736229.1 glycosyltransferase [Deltaproteobacteria bacterium]MBW1908528.1 glycosyltransferase [Deltaproteobacteria bacterium]MBW2032369.1 glycosyltransferase [Deltaproteobacteria bacterium]MBW2113584.1 glycosyltransferase [Deltaproteobacteria bacterium]